MDIQSSDFFFLRRPLISIDKLFSLYQIIGNQYETYENELINFFNHPVILESIYLATPNLYSAVISLINGNCKEDKNRLLQSMHKYLIRMASRATPYGLFAGCTIGEFSDNTSIQFCKKTPYRKHSRLDMNYVSELVISLLKKDTIRSEIKFYPNTSLYKVGKNYRYMESKLANKKREYELSSVKSNAFLENIFCKAKNGSTPKMLVDELTSMKIPVDEALDYINELINAQLLVSELEVTVTGEEFFQVLINKLKKISNTQNDVKVLCSTQKILRNQDYDIGKYKRVQSLINNQFVKAKSKDLIQTDLFFNTNQCKLSHNFVSTLANDFKKIIPLARTDRDQNLEKFRLKFYERFEEREIPLLKVVDNEVGIGYGNITAGKADHLPLLDNIKFPSSGNNYSVEWSPLLQMKHKLYSNAIQNRESIIRITDQMIQEYQNSNNSQPFISSSFYIFGSLIASSETEIDKGDFKFQFNSIGGTSGASLLARFCHGDDKIHDKIKMLMETEADHNSDHVLAEIAHLPESRVGNIISRPSFRKFEISYLAGISNSGSHQIDPEDIMVSVPKGREIVLRSKELNKRIIPRLTNAHNTAKGLPVYKFLCDLSYQGLDYNFNWSWDFLSFQPFLPRVEYRHLILSRAVWNINKEDYRFLNSKHFDSENLLLLKDKLNIPRYVQIKNKDNELLIDFHSKFSLQILWDKIQKDGYVRLVEFLNEPRNCFLKDENGKYTNEIVIPFFANNKVANPKNQVQTRKLSSDVPRQFVPGSEWLYVKIYLGTKTGDQVLTKIIFPFVQKLFNEQIIDKWFFIRFVDPDYHLRLRFHSNENRTFWQYILQELNAELDNYLQQGLIHKIQTDTYLRELERYGSSSISQMENVFFADSEAVLSLLDLLEGGEREEYRWLIALRGVDSLLDDCGFDLTQKLQLLEKLQSNFFKEFNGDKRLYYSLNDNYRAFTSKIQSIMDHSKDMINGFEEVNAILQKRSDQIKSILTNIIDKKEVDIVDLVSSLVHMFLNRIFISNPRPQELVLYHYLHKYYKSSLARMKHSKKYSIKQLVT